MQVAAEMAVLVLEEAADVKVRKLSVVRFDHHVELAWYSRLSRFDSRSVPLGILHMRTVLELTLYEP